MHHALTIHHPPPRPRKPTHPSNPPPRTQDPRPPLPTARLATAALSALTVDAELSPSSAAPSPSPAPRRRARNRPPSSAPPTTQRPTACCASPSTASWRASPSSSASWRSSTEMCSRAPPGSAERNAPRRRSGGRVAHPPRSPGRCTHGASCKAGTRRWGFGDDGVFFGDVKSWVWPCARDIEAGAATSHTVFPIASKICRRDIFK
ncbi:hypothetical protein EYC84_006747 [Monilinia fructicola]|uniref:Uncharacterized protein n=1 Tax=Monilinia fructicola TaxID=38448 RepID=A0A5M9K847_MONFR|nr:hypothetical protein EYC84_006747 [Monilinia fructicola]